MESKGRRRRRKIVLDFIAASSCFSCEFFAGPGIPHTVRLQGQDVLRNLQRLLFCRRFSLLFHPSPEGQFPHLSSLPRTRARVHRATYLCRVVSQVEKGRGGGELCFRLLLRRRRARAYLLSWGQTFLRREPSLFRPEEGGSYRWLEDILYSRNNCCLTPSFFERPT